jgi:hypothetical protein
MKKPLAVLAALSLSAAGLVAGTAPAQADTRCYIDNFSPRTVVAGLSPVLATFNVKTSDCWNNTGWDVQGEDYSFYVYQDNPDEVFEPYDNTDAGARDVIVTATDDDYDESTRIFTNGFSLKRRTEWSPVGVNATPEPVKKGSTITITGRLKIANWAEQRYDGYSKRNIAVEFRTATGSYSTVKTITSGSGGYVKTTVTAVRDGVWRFRYAGNSYAGGATAVGDSVDVK